LSSITRLKSFTASTVPKLFPISSRTTFAIPYPPRLIPSYPPSGKRGGWGEDYVLNLI
jgi:hypothetical protein